MDVGGLYRSADYYFDDDCGSDDVGGRTGDVCGQDVDASSPQTGVQPRTVKKRTATPLQGPDGVAPQRRPHLFIDTARRAVVPAVWNTASRRHVARST